MAGDTGQIILMGLGDNTKRVRYVFSMRLMYFTCFMWTLYDTGTDKQVGSLSRNQKYRKGWGENAIETYNSH